MIKTPAKRPGFFYCQTVKSLDKTAYNVDELVFFSYICYS
jgi:hypothetical protein